MGEEFHEAEEREIDLGACAGEARDPVTAAVAYIDALAGGRSEEAWARATERFRYRQARHWVWGRRFAFHDRGWDVEDLVRDLALRGPDHPVWPDLARAQRNGARRTGFPGRAGWVPCGPPEPVGPDRERLAFARAETPGEPSLWLLLELADGRWAVGALEMQAAG